MSVAWIRSRRAGTHEDHFPLEHPDSQGAYGKKSVVDSLTARLG
ncbi:MAG: hypothetical protein R2788_05590 [Saprospiraceae bacterium]